MLPKGALGSKMLGKLKVYAGPDHPHAAQMPIPLDLPAARRGLLSEGRSSMPKPLVQSTGRRKRAVARVRLRDGEGAITINKRSFEEYFPSATHRTHATEPLRIAGAAESYDVDATIDGGGIAGQAGALRLGIAEGPDRARRRAPREPEEGRAFSHATLGRRRARSTA